MPYNASVMRPMAVVVPNLLVGSVSNLVAILTLINSVYARSAVCKYRVIAHYRLMTVTVPWS